MFSDAWPITMVKITYPGHCLAKK